MPPKSQASSPNSPSPSSSQLLLGPSNPSSLSLQPLASSFCKMHTWDPLRTHPSRGVLTCLSVSSPVLASPHMSWGVLTHPSMSSPVLACPHPSRGILTCLSVSSCVLACPHTSWGVLTRLRVSSPVSACGVLTCLGMWCPYCSRGVLTHLGMSSPISACPHLSWRILCCFCHQQGCFPHALKGGRECPEDPQKGRCAMIPFFSLNSLLKSHQKRTF